MTSGLELPPLYPYQEEGVTALSALLRKNRSALLADCPGAGKSPQAIFTALELKCSKILIVCPASLRETWKREMERWSQGAIATHAATSGKDALGWLAAELPFLKDYPPGKGVALAASYDLASQDPLLSALGGAWDMLICDESHFLKAASSLRARACLVLLWRAARYRLLLSGTPIPNGRASEAWTTFSRLAPDLFGSWERYKERYCVEEITPRGPTYPRSKNLEELGRLARERFMVRRPKSLVLQSLPPLVRQEIYLDIPALKVAEAMEDVASEVARLIADVKSGGGIPLQSDPIATARRKLGILKVPPALEVIQELMEGDEREKGIVVFCHHKEVYAALGDALRRERWKVVGIQGSMLPKERQEAVDAFQGGRSDVFLASIHAASTGLTLTRSRTVVFVEADWVPSVNEQAEARVCRLTQRDLTRALYLLVPESLDDAVMRSVLRKQRDIRKVMEGYGICN